MGWAYIDLVKEWGELKQGERQLLRQRLINRRTPHLSILIRLLQSMRTCLDRLTQEAICHPALDSKEALSLAITEIGDSLAEIGYTKNLYPKYIQGESSKRRWDACNFTSMLDAKGIGISRFMSADPEWNCLAQSLEIEHQYFGECGLLAEHIRDYCLLIEDNANSQLFNAYISQTRHESLKEVQGGVFSKKAMHIGVDKLLDKITKRIAQLCDGDDAK